MKIDILIANIIGVLSGSTVTAIALLWLFIKNPEKVEKWASMIMKVGAYFSERMEKNYMATNIQSTSSGKRKELGMDGDVLSYDLRIKWTQEELAEIDLKENKVIVMMRRFDSQSKNLANVVSLYVPKALLPKSRRYIEPNLIKGIDFIISKKLLDDNPTSLNYYVEREIVTHSEKIIECLELLEPLNSVGRLSRVVIPEFQKLSGLYPQEPNLNVHNETIQLIRKLNTFESAPPGVEPGGSFLGDYIKMTMVPVGKGVNISLAGITPHFEYIKRQIKEGIEHFYIVSAHYNNIFAKELVRKACREINLNLVFEEKYKGIFRGRKTDMYCALCSLEGI